MNIDLLFRRTSVIRPHTILQSAGQRIRQTFHIAGVCAVVGNLAADPKFPQLFQNPPEGPVETSRILRATLNVAYATNKIYNPEGSR